MKLVVKVALFVFTFAPSAFAQIPAGPGGVGVPDGTTSLQGWWRGDKGVTSAAGSVTAWADNSGYNHTLSPPGSQPTVTTNATLNGQSIIRYTAASSQYFTASSYFGPGTANLTMFFVANGTSYQSLLRFQNSGGIFVVFPWNSGSPVNSFISSTEGGTGGGIASGVVASVNNIAGARLTALAANGMQTWLNGGLLNQKNSVGTTLPSQTLYSGKYSGGSEYPNCDVGEMIVYHAALNDAQMIIVQNYLSAKFNSALTANDVYTMDNPGNGNYDFDVAGVGRVNASNLHSDAKGTGFVRILNPTDLGDNEYFMWGHDNGTAQATNTTDIPPGVTARFARTWRVSEVGEVGNIDIQFDVTGLPDFATLSICDASTSIRLLVDTNNDGNFADQTPIAGATNIGGNVYRFASVTPVNTGNRFTIAIVSSGVTGPGGVGGANGTTNLTLWMDAAKGVSTSGASVNSWTDQSGNGIIATPQTAGNRPTLATGILNGQPVVSFSSASSQYLQMSSNITAVAPSLFMVLNKPAVGAGRMTMLALAQNQWSARSAATDQWGMLAGVDVLSGTTLNATYTVLSSLERAFNDIDFYTNETLANRTTGTAATGKTIGTIGSSNANALGTGTEFLNANVAELAVYNTVVNSAQRIIIDNYLSAKYGLTLNLNDIYTQDNGVAPNDFDYDVAGIGRVNVTNQHSDARGTGILRVSNPSSLGDGDYLLWGHNNLPLVAVTTDLPATVQAKFQRIWAVNEVNEVGTIDMQFDLTGQNPVTASDLRLVIDPEGNGIFNEGTTIVISGAVALSCNNYLFTAIPGASLNNNMRFTIGTANKINTPLPIELLSFYGTTGINGVELHWTTATEHNSDYFSIERSRNGEKFSEVLNRRAAGNSTGQKSYSAMDLSAPVGKIYYRLKSVDYDGKYSYSKIIAVDNPFAESKIMVSPNPVRIGSDLEIRFLNFGELDGGEIIVGLSDMLGRHVSVTLEKKGDNIFAVKTGATPAAGFYILKIKSSGWTREYVQRVYISE